MPVSIIPAQPGFFSATRVIGAPQPEALLDPIIAWAIHTGGSYAYVTPITAEDGEMTRLPVIVRPDGTVSTSEATYKSVGEWLKSEDSNG